MSGRCPPAPRTVLSLAAAVCALLLGVRGFAADYWVATAGNDTAAGGPDAPFRTIRRGVAAAAPGDTVWVRAGRYEECVSVPKEKSGAPGKWLTISAAPGDERKAVVGTEVPRVDAYGSMSSAFSLREVQYVRVRGFTCVAPYRGRGSGIGAGKSRHIQVLNCVVTGGGQGGVDANHCDHVLIDGVEAFFNGGGSGWSSGVSLLEPKTKDNVVRNCVCYGNYDGSSYRSDGNGIIIDNAYTEGGALVTNNLCYMNGGKGISTTRSDDCRLFHNTCVANCWQINQQETAHEITVRGARNIVRNNIGVAVLPKGVGMLVLPSYSTRKGRVDIDPKSILCDHNLFFNPGSPACVMLAGNRRTYFTLEQLREAMPHWAGDTLSVDPGFVDMKNLDFRLHPDSPALNAGTALPEVTTDSVGTARPGNGPCSLGCYEGAHEGTPVPSPEPGVAIADGEDETAIRALLANEYELSWHGMLWGWGKLLTEELPLRVEVRGPRRADFLHVEGRFVLRELLDQITREHEVRLVLSRPEASRGLGTGPEVITPQLAVRRDADADERAFVRQALRQKLWTDDREGRTAFVELAPALSAALGVRIESVPPLPDGPRFPMVTRNMKLSVALDDVARRLGVRFVLSRHDPLGAGGGARDVALDRPFGSEDGLVELTVDQPDGRGYVNMFARVQADSCLCARLFTNNSRFIAPPGIDSEEGGPMVHKASTRLDPGTKVRLAVSGDGCALSVGGEWVLLSKLHRSLTAGGFRLRAVSEWVKVSNARYAPL